MKTTLYRWASAKRAILSGLSAWLTGPPVARLHGHLRLPLFWNGYTLLFNAMATSGLGIVYWALAARYYTANAVGLNSAMLSAMTFVAGITTLGLNSGLVRFIPLAGLATKRLVAYTYMIGIGLAAIASLALGLSLSRWTPALGFIGATPVWLLSFVIASLAWCLFTLQDSVLTGLRQTAWVAVENIVFAGIKIALLLFLARISPQYGILFSWIVPVAVSLLPINLLIFRRLIPRHIEAIGGQAAVVSPRPIFKFIAGNYLGSAFFVASTTLLPIIVISQAGTTANAYFYLPWLIATGLQMVALNMATSLTVEAAIDLTRLSEYSYRILIHTLRLLVPMVIVILLGAPIIMRIFGSEYATAGTGLLRWLALAAIPNAVVALSISLARVQNRVGTIILVQGVLCILGLSLSYLFLPIWGLTGIGLAWLATQTMMAVFIGFTFLRPILQNGRMWYRRKESDKAMV